jgi:hypothetical protein
MPANRGILWDQETTWWAEECTVEYYHIRCQERESEEHYRSEHQEVSIRHCVNTNEEILLGSIFCFLSHSFINKLASCHVECKVVAHLFGKL